MKTDTHHFLMSLFLSMACVSSCFVDAKGIVASPHSLLREVSKSGATDVVRSLYLDRRKWGFVVHRIASGEKPWVDVGITLLAGSDAGPSSEIHDALFEALAKNPSVVLTATEPALSGELCGGRSDPLATYDAAMHELLKIQRAVSRVSEVRLRVLKQLCLRNLDENKEQLRRFFEVRSE